jgi:hypothetical protein
MAIAFLTVTIQDKQVFLTVRQLITALGAFYIIHEDCLFFQLV